MIAPGKRAAAEIAGHPGKSELPVGGDPLVEPAMMASPSASPANRQAGFSGVHFVASVAASVQSRHTGWTVQAAAKAFLWKKSRTGNVHLYRRSAERNKLYSIRILGWRSGMESEICTTGFGKLVILK